MPTHYLTNTWSTQLSSLSNTLSVYFTSPQLTSPHLTSPHLTSTPYNQTTWNTSNHTLPLSTQPTSHMEDSQTLAYTNHTQSQYHVHIHNQIHEQTHSRQVNISPPTTTTDMYTTFNLFMMTSGKVQSRLMDNENLHWTAVLPEWRSNLVIRQTLDSVGYVDWCCLISIYVSVGCVNE